MPKHQKLRENHFSSRGKAVLSRGEEKNARFLKFPPVTNVVVGNATQGEVPRRPALRGQEHREEPGGEETGPGRVQVSGRSLRVAGAALRLQLHSRRALGHVDQDGPGGQRPGTRPAQAGCDVGAKMEAAPVRIGRRWAADVDQS